MIWRQKHLVLDALFDLVIYCFFYCYLLFHVCLCALMVASEFCVAGNLGQEALVKEFFNLSVLFLVKQR